MSHPNQMDNFRVMRRRTPSPPPVAQRILPNAGPVIGPAMPPTMFAKPKPTLVVPPLPLPTNSAAIVAAAMAASLLMGGGVGGAGVGGVGGVGVGGVGGVGGAVGGVGGVGHVGNVGGVANVAYGGAPTVGALGVPAAAAAAASATPAVGGALPNAAIATSAAFGVGSEQLAKVRRPGASRLARARARARASS